MKGDEFQLFHWSPTARRKSINHHGIDVGRRSVDALWKPPYSCWADSVSLAWALSGKMHPEIGSWDLWIVWTSSLPGYETIPFDDGTVKEYRVYQRIYKRDIWLAAVRDWR